MSVSVGPTQSYALARNKSEGAIRFHEREEKTSFEGSVPNTYQNTDGNRPYANANAANALPSANATDMGYASDVCDYSMAPKKKDSPTNRGLNQIKLDDSYVQQKRPVSMVSPSIKPVTPHLESSLCDRRQQVIQHRAKTFMGDNSSVHNGFDNNRFINNNNSSNNNNCNNNSFSPASLTARSDFISGFT